MSDETKVSGKDLYGKRVKVVFREPLPTQGGVKVRSLTGTLGAMTDSKVYLQTVFTFADESGVESLREMGYSDTISMAGRTCLLNASLVESVTEHADIESVTESPAQEAAPAQEMRKCMEHFCNEKRWVDPERGELVLCKGHAQLVDAGIRRAPPLRTMRDYHAVARRTIMVEDLNLKKLLHGPVRGRDHAVGPPGPRSDCTHSFLSPSGVSSLSAPISGGGRRIFVHRADGALLRRRAEERVSWGLEEPSGGVGEG